LVLGLLGIIISGVLPIFLNSITANKSAEYYSTAYKILDSKIEEYRNADFDTLASYNFQVTGLPSGQGVLAVTNNIEGTPQVDIKKLTLTISWNFKNQKQVRAVTYISRGGIKK
jgi:type II secretory pathway pseudopilin PulG